ncbi:hypothetical protein O3M35_005105 [Rhynocoris fuscipes]|uniref:Nif11 domain-containing protein n=1 Tax=Rhynocoris fuscipes TaxID=488301 RepID=A0AAW1DMB9_9HEMI
MNHVWKKIWPECIKTTDAVVNFLPEVRQNILDLAHDLGFEDLNESDVLDLLAADREPLSYEELIQLQAEPAIDEDTEPVVNRERKTPQPRLHPPEGKASSEEITAWDGTLSYRCES